MNSCEHKNCGREKNVWFPIKDNNPSDILLHSWYIHCGKIKNMTEYKPHRLGFWLNILSKIVKSNSLKEVQKRLILKNLEKNDCFFDLYNVNEKMQIKAFKKIIEKFCLISENSVESLIYSS